MFFDEFVCFIFFFLFFVFLYFFFFFFFFQAEDGIRDADVTGVQTCALPICCCRLCRVIRLLVGLWICCISSMRKRLRVRGTFAPGAVLLQGRAACSSTRVGCDMGWRIWADRKSVV